MSYPCHCCGYWPDRTPEEKIASYQWTCAANGNTVYLCAACCAAWRCNAIADPGLAASRITSLREAA